MGFTDPHPGLKVLDHLNNGETVDLEGSGIFVKKIPGELKPGDDYVGAFNTVNLLTVKSVDERHGWVFPQEEAYAYDLYNTVKVEIVTC